ncbi:amidohydrolase [bacterium]|nr:amidohydrolase [bacterium]
MRRLPVSGLSGHGWAQGLWEGGRFPQAAALDAVAPENPVLLRAKSGHAAWVNSLALRIAGIDAQTPDPAGGSIGRDASGQPDGVLFETAMELVRQHIPEQTTEQLVAQMKVAQAQALAAGLTGFHDFDGPECLRALQILRERGELALRAVKNINKEWIEHAHALGLRWGFGDPWLRLGGLKIFADGALGPLTAWMIAPYAGDPANMGICVTDPEEMVALVSRASAAGLPSTIHAIGDRAVREVLNVYETVRKEEALRGDPPATRRHRIEHVQIVHPDDINRLAELDLIASMQPVHATSDYEVADRHWGERCQWAYNPRMQLDRGVTVAFGSDSPIDPFAPLPNLYAAVARRRLDGSPGPEGWYPQAKVTVEEALRGFTRGPAYAAGLERQAGQLAPGFLADLVVLDRDLLRVPVDEIPDITIQATMVEGQWRFGGI